MGETSEIDHYAILGFPAASEESLTLTLKEIEKAYRNQSRIRHPDKRPDDPNATADFQQLTESFNFLKDESKRATFDAKIRSRIEKKARDALYGAKRRKLASDLDEREKAAERDSGHFEEATKMKREKDVAAETKRELEEFMAKKAKKAHDFAQAFNQEKRDENGGVNLDKERVLKVSWERELGDYSSVKLREIFERFGRVEDVVIRSKKKKGSAIVVMSSKDAVVAATHAMSGSLSNPLLVLPLQSDTSSRSSYFPTDTVETIDPKVANFADYESDILKKLEEASKRKKSTK